MTQLAPLFRNVTENFEKKKLFFPLMSQLAPLFRKISKKKLLFFSFKRNKPFIFFAIFSNLIRKFKFILSEKNIFSDS
jgi:hypothetical protein